MPRGSSVRGRLGLLGLALTLVGCGTASTTFASTGVSTITPSPEVTRSSHPTVATTPAPKPSRHSVVKLAVREFGVVAGSHPHDVAPAPDGGVWYTGQLDGTLGHLDPSTGKVRTIKLGAGSAPHGVITAPDGSAWITDGGLNAIVRVDAGTDAVTVFPLPATRRGANLNTAAFDRDGTLWFTGQTGVYGRLEPATGDMAVFDDPDGRGPYGITATPSGEIWYASLAANHIAKVDPATGRSTMGRAADAKPGCPPRVGRWSRADLGQRMECGPGRRPRSGVRRMARVETAGQGAPGICRLRRRS